MSKARITVRRGRTLNTGNYTSARYDVGIEFDVDSRDELPRAFEKARKWVDNRLDDLINEGPDAEDTTGYVKDRS